MSHIIRKYAVRLLLAASLVLLLSHLGSHRLLAQQPAIQVETTSTFQLTFPQAASEPELAQQLADQLAAAASSEAAPFLRQAEFSASLDAVQLGKIAHDVRTLVGNGFDATTTALIFTQAQTTVGDPVLCLLNIQSRSVLAPTTSLLTAHEVQHARINNELARRLTPLIFATKKGNDPATAEPLAVTLVGLLHAGGVAFDTATDHGRQGDQEAEAIAVIELVTHTAETELGWLAVGS